VGHTLQLQKGSLKNDFVCLLSSGMQWENTLFVHMCWLYDGSSRLLKLPAFTRPSKGAGEF